MNYILFAMCFANYLMLKFLGNIRMINFFYYCIMAIGVILSPGSRTCFVQQVMHLITCIVFL